jgi:hypothetical protein
MRSILLGKNSGPAHWIQRVTASPYTDSVERDDFPRPQQFSRLTDIFSVCRNYHQRTSSSKNSPSRVRILINRRKEDESKENVSRHTPSLPRACHTPLRTDMAKYSRSLSVAASGFFYGVDHAHQFPQRSHDSRENPPERNQSRAPRQTPLLRQHTCSAIVFRAIHTMEKSDGQRQSGHFAGRVTVPSKVVRANPPI